jgi:bifunctional non-homologous end joining protein LigD
MADNLDSYRAKRDFSATSEPAGAPRDEGALGGAPRDDAAAAGAPRGAPPEGENVVRFVVQEHHARSLHWDLRIEHEGTLASWAVPKGIPPDPSRNHLAVRTEDHPLEYLDFHGEIPAGQYGAGTMAIWDRGTCEIEKFRDREVMAVFHGERMRGRYVLFRTRGKDWMIHRMDPPEDPDREPMPERLEPMLARTGPLPKDDDKWAYEIKWDGVRAIGYASGGRLRLASRLGRDITPRYPELRDLGRALAAREAVIDGEVVAFDENGRPSFQRLQRRMHLASEHAVRRLAGSEPVAYIIFDLLWLDGRPLMGLPYEERRARLLELGLQGPRWQTPAHHVGDGQAMLDASRAQGLEGVVAKRLDSLYTPGRRSQAWVKVKNFRSVDAVIGGWMPGEGRRGGRLGALLVGFYEDGKLRYAGRVGSGFSEAELDRVGKLLDPLARDSSPFTATAVKLPKEARFVEPELVASVEYGELTQAHTLRHPVYKGLRDDVDPKTVEFSD